ncbi:MAG: ABC transporter, partial [Flavobacteriaceae bacterium]|nr:ABC transporter [Flavobacteriaceae bacterium]
MKELKHLNKYFLKYKWKVIIGIIITIVSKIFLLFTPELIGSSIDVVDDFRKGIITDVSVVKTELLINILYIIGAAIITG